LFAPLKEAETKKNHHPNLSDSKSATIPGTTGPPAWVRDITMDKFKDDVEYVLSNTGYVIAWVNKTAKGIVQKLFGLNPEFVDETHLVSVTIVVDGQSPGEGEAQELELTKCHTGGQSR
jgi:hypothetical protein